MLRLNNEIRNIINIDELRQSKYSEKERLKKTLQDYVEQHYTNEKLSEIMKSKKSVNIKLRFITETKFVSQVEITNIKDEYEIVISDDFLFSIIGTFDIIKDHTLVGTPSEFKPMESGYTDILTQAFIIFVLNHEVAHILHGHFNIDNDGDLYKIMEYDADCFAISRAMGMILIDYKKNNKETFLKVKFLMHSISVFCTLFVNLEEKVNINKISHPSSIIRLAYIYGTLKDIIYFNDNSFNFQLLEQDVLPFYGYFLNKFFIKNLDSDDILYHKDEINQLYKDKYYKELKIKIKEHSYIDVKFIDGIPIKGIEGIDGISIDSV